MSTCKIHGGEELYNSSPPGKEFNAFTWIFIDSHEFQWICMDLYEFIVFSMDFCGFSCIYVDFGEFRKIWSQGVCQPVAGCGGL